MNKYKVLDTVYNIDVDDNLSVSYNYLTKEMSILRNKTMIKMRLEEFDKVFEAVKDLVRHCHNNNP